MTACPSDDALGAFVHRALDEREAEAVAAHLDECTSCRQLVVAAVRAGLGASEAPTSPGGEVDKSGLELGARIGRYQVRGLLGSGGMGRVYEAFDPELDRAIALKVMRPELTRLTAVLAERLVRESRLMAKVVDPAVIAVHDVGRTGDAVFIAMELIRGETLGAYVRRVRPPWRAIVELLGRAGRGLAAAHAAGVIHRDFKPDNVLVELDGARAARVVVTDFGVARAFADELDAVPSARAAPGSRDPALTTTGMAVGTPAYMSPQQLEGEPVDHRADVFAFAVTAWEMLFGERPYDGATAVALRVAMERPPVPPRGHAVPSRVIRAVARGLAVEPPARWPEMTAFLRALAGAARPQHRTVTVAAIAGIALAGSALAGSRVVASEAPDPCAAGLAALDAAYTAEDARRLRTGLAHPRTGEVADKLAEYAAAWRTVHRATCRASAAPIQPMNTAACLDARRLELAGAVDDLLSGDARANRHADTLVGFVGNPASCREPASGLLAARVPVDPAVRVRVTDARYQIIEAEAARDRGDFTSAAALASAALRASELAGWPPIRSEAMYVVATTAGGDPKLRLAKMSEAAAFAERVHYDPIAAQAWLQLSQVATTEIGDAVRGLEYVGYAEAALDRLGRPLEDLALLEYSRAIALMYADRFAEAEVHMQRALALAEQHDSEMVSVAVQGLALLHEEAGNFAAAVATYQRAIAKLRADDVGGGVVYRQLLSSALATTGRVAESEAVAREAVALADRALSETSLDRASTHHGLAQTIGHSGRFAEGLAAARAATAWIGRIVGERSARYGEALRLDALLLHELGRNAEAAPVFARACELIAFGPGEDSTEYAECQMYEMGVLIGLRRHADAIARGDHALAVLRKSHQERFPLIANTYRLRGAAGLALGRADALADLERARSLFDGQELDPGYLAATKWTLGRALWPREPARARQLVEEAVAGFAKAPGLWAGKRNAAAAWLAAHR